MQHKPGRLTVGVVGSGKVGPILALALAGAGHYLTAITATGESARERVAAMLPELPILPADEVVKSCQLVIFAVPGDELPQLVAGLTKMGAWQAGQLVAHTAPEHGYSVFAPALTSGVIPLALSPVIVFSGTSLDLARLQESSCVVSAPDPVLPIAQALAVEIGAEPLVLTDESRAEYAQIISYIRDFSASLVQQSDRRLREIGVADPHKISEPLIASSISEALRVADPLSYESEFDEP